MKKAFLLVMACASVILLTGCGNEKKVTPPALDNTKKMICTRISNQNGIDMNLKYQVSYKDSYVTTVESNEIVTIDDATAFAIYKETIEKTYERVKDIQYYDTDLKIDGNVLTSTIKIDYTKIDVNKLLEIDPSMKKVIKNGKINVEDLETVYNSMEITCEK